MPLHVCQTCFRTLELAYGARIRSARFDTRSSLYQISLDSLRRLRQFSSTAKTFRSEEGAHDNPSEWSRPLYSSADDTRQDTPATATPSHSSLRERRARRREASIRDIQSRARFKTFSLPEPRLYAGDTMAEVRRNQQGRSADGCMKPTWYATRATPPLLLTLDAFGTLYAPRESVAKQYCDVAAKYGHTFNEEDIKASFKSAYKAMLREHPNYGKATDMPVESWWRELIARTLRPHSSSTEALNPDIMSALYNRFATREGYTLFEDVRPFLQQVGASFSASSWPPKRTLLGILSNSDPRARSVLSSFGIDLRPGLYPPRHAPVHRHDDPEFGPASLSFAALSYELEVEKPNPKIFDLALRLAQEVLGEHAAVARLTRSGRELLSSVRTEFWHCHVGDRVDLDVVPALDAGWDAILLDRAATAPISTRVEGLHDITVINSLAALPEVLTPARARASMERGAAVREERASRGDGHALDFEDWVNPRGTVGHKPSEIRTRESAWMLGGPEADARRRQRMRERNNAILNRQRHRRNSI